VNDMKKDDVFPSKYVKAADLRGKSVVVEIDRAPLEKLKNTKGEEQVKVVLYFVKQKKALPLNLTNFDAVAAICGEDTEDWPGNRIELFPTTTTMAGKTVDCIRIRSPLSRERPPMSRPAAPTPPADLDDEIPF
jgi:hypothetical protein